ncbi:transcription factor MYB98-like [Cynara cardunculus var. scolymus]|uniref:transcription factor MYB98-like n=1 Tax=Cynara cardunculus var. scolymus TaxID=59895 RepID=UPI000D62A343|nr:transcription factor MYB98-like [Cynara cardunculus var. scolymus]
MDQQFSFQMFGSAFANSPREFSCLSSIENDRHKKPNGRKNNNARKKSGKDWRKTLIIKGQWNSEEDRLLMQLVKQYGDSKWSRIAEKLPGRIAKQCRDRWQNHLRPDITVSLPTFFLNVSTYIPIVPYPTSRWDILDSFGLVYVSNKS